MRVYFSGGTGKLSPEYLIHNRNPHVMLTFVEVWEHPTYAGWAKDRLGLHVRRKQGVDPNSKPNACRANKAIKTNRLPNVKLRKGKIL